MLDTMLCAAKNLNRKRLRSLLTVSGITVGVMLVVIVSIIGNIGKAVVNNELENLGISGLSVSANSGSTLGKNGISEDDLNTIRMTAGVETAMPLVVEYASSILCGVSENTLICGIDAGAKQAISLTLKHGRLISGGDVKAMDMVCIIDETLAIKTYGRGNITGKNITLQLRGIQEEFRIIGVASAESSLVQSLGGLVPSMVYIPYSSLQSITGRETFDQIAVRVSVSADVSTAEKNILDRLQRSTGLSGYYRTDNLSTQRDKLGGLLDIVSAILTVISGISLVVSGLGIMTIMMVSVNERMREIGIKKAIGASDYRIMGEFLLEAVIISLLGAVTGITSGISLSIIGGLIIGVAVPISWTSFAYLTAFTVVIGTLFGIYPAVKASRLRPVDALRME